MVRIESSGENSNAPGLSAPGPGSVTRSSSVGASGETRGVLAWDANSARVPLSTTFT